MGKGKNRKKKGSEGHERDDAARREAARRSEVDARRAGLMEGGVRSDTESSSGESMKEDAGEGTSRRPLKIRKRPRLERGSGEAVDGRPVTLPKEERLPRLPVEL